jgi:hypothetical protein
MSTASAGAVFTVSAILLSVIDMVCMLVNADCSFKEEEAPLKHKAQLQ